MSQQLSTTGVADALHSIVINGDLSKMTEGQKVNYYMQFCESLGLNPVTQPFAILKFQNKEVLYAKKDATEQLRKLHGISVTDLTSEITGTTFIVTCKVKDKYGKTDMSTGIVSIENQKGENLANAMMKAETKAKRRATLSICGLGMLDESEIQSVDADARVVDIPVSNRTPPPLTDNAFGQAVARIQKGETQLIQKLRENYQLTQAQSDTLLAMEDANSVPA